MKSYTPSYIAATLAAVSVFPVYANTDNADREEIVVTTTRSNYNVETPALVEVIDSEEIRRSAAITLVDLLRNRGSVRVTDLFGDGSKPTISIRGFGENASAHALVLVNGRRLNNNDLSAPDLNSIALKDVLSVEILEGSASTLYGDQAVGGVINVITHSARGQSSYVRLSGGSYNARAVAIGVAGALSETWSSSLSLLQRESDNYRDHNQAKYKNATARLEHNGKNHRQVIELQYVDDYLETPGALFAAEVAADRRQVTANFVDDYIDVETVNARLGFAGSLSEQWDYEVDFTARDSDGSFIQSSQFGKETIPATQDRKLWSINPRLIAYLPSASGDILWVSGIDYDDADYSLVSRFGPQTSEQYVVSYYSRVVQPLSAEIEMTYGLRYARSNNEVFDVFKFAVPTSVRDDVWGGELGFRFDLSNNTEAYGRVERVYRFGKIDEHTTFITTAPLNPTTGYSYEVGAQHTAGDLKLRAALWQIDLKNEIAFDPAIFTNINLPPTQRIGLTLFAGVDLTANTALSLSGSLVDAKVESGAYQGKNVPLVPRYNLRMAINQRFCETFTGMFEWQLVGKQASSGDFANQFKPLPSYDVVNIALVWAPSQHEFSLRVNNVLDAEYSEFGAIGANPNNGFANEEAFQTAPEINANLAWRYSF